ncbi:MAG: hypothetical protein IJV69_05760 [Kiritimatiellae bacterium]|nr:hypothetical protein [Kiritimatiellia bacterium]
MRFVRRNSFKAWSLPLSAAAVLLTPAMTLAEAAVDPALEAEIRYIDELSKNGYVDFADDVIEAAKKKWPTAKGVLETATVRAELAAGKQDAVLAKINARPDKDSLDTWLQRLELAASYFQYSKFNEADKIYSEFFKKFTKVDASVKTAYINAAYYYIAMLNKIDRGKETLPIYKLAMEQAPTDALQKDLRAQYLQALLVQAEQMAAGKERDDTIKQAEDIASKMVWVQDNYFGDAINGLAHAKMLKGDVKGAQEMIQDYVEMLMQIHEQYRTEDPDGSKGYLRMSPLPQCRYLLGKMLYDKAKEEIAKGGAANEDTIKNLLLGERDPSTKKRNGQGAFNHLVNVYMNFPESQSAALAGDFVEEITKLIQSRYNTTLKVNVSPEQRAKVRQQQYVQANVAFDSGDWENAVAAYTKTISQYGLNQEALPAIRKMIEATIRSGAKGGQLDPYSKLQAETLTAALAEGFSGMDTLKDRAGDTLRQTADLYNELGLAAMKEATYKLFFKYYPKHPAAVAMQLQQAKEKAAAGDAEGAAQLYINVRDAATTADQREQRTAALAALVNLYGPSGAAPDVTKEMAAAKDFVAHFDGIARPGIYAANAEFLLGDAYRHQGEALRKAVTDTSNDKKITACYGQAAKIYNGLIKELSKDDNKYVSAADERDRAKTMLENSLYQRGVCMQRLPASGDAKKEKALKAQAEKYFNDYLTKFPKGKLAPAAMLQIGTLQAATGNIEGSRATLAKLAKDFPTSDEAKNSIPMLADSLFKMGMKGEATNTYKQMFAAGGTYTAAQYQTAAEKLLEAGEAKLALEACDCILKGNNKAYKPKAMLMRTKALLADNQSGAAYKQISELLETYGNTTVAVDANHALLEVIGAQVLNASTFEERNELIGKAKKAVTFLSAQADRNAGDNPAVADAEKVRLNLAVADVARQAYEAEKKANSERIRTALGSALNAYRQAMFAGATPVTEAAVSPNVQKAYKGYLELTRDLAEVTTDAQEKKDILRDIVDLGTEYQDKFPEGTYKTDVLNAVLQAKIELGE